MLSWPEEHKHSFARSSTELLYFLLTRTNRCFWHISQFFLTDLQMTFQNVQAETIPGFLLPPPPFFFPLPRIRTCSSLYLRMQRVVGRQCSLKMSLLFRSNIWNSLCPKQNCWTKRSQLCYSHNVRAAASQRHQSKLTRQVVTSIVHF